MTENGFFQCLKSRYGGNDYCLIPQVRNATGLSARIRTADAIAVSLWPSRGVGIEGFEFKDSRTDWKKELDNPAKAEEIGRFCYAWWLVVSDKTIVHSGELPPTWGLMLAAGDKVKVIEKPKQAMESPQIPTWPFIAALLKAAAVSVVPEAEISKRIERARSLAADESYKKGVEQGERYGKETKRELEELRKAVAAFELGSGCRLCRWNSENENRRIGAAVRLAEALVDLDFITNYERHLQCGLEAAAVVKAELAKLSAPIAAGEQQGA